MTKDKSGIIICQKVNRIRETGKGIRIMSIVEHIVVDKSFSYILFVLPAKFADRYYLHFLSGKIGLENDLLRFHIWLVVEPSLDPKSLFRLQQEGLLVSRDL